MSPEDALNAIVERADPTRAKAARAYHKVERTYLGVPNPELDALCRAWRAQMDRPDWITTADYLWKTDIYEARVAAAKLLTVARMRPDDSAAFALITSWAPDFDSWAIADHACMAGQRRLLAAPERVAQIEPWTRAESLWMRRAALVITLPWTKQNHPTGADLAIREEVLGWAASYVPDRAWFIQKAIAWWLRALSKHDPERVAAFLEVHGADLKPFALREARKYLPT